MSLKKKVTDGFRSRFGHRPEAVVRSPGRVNLIGEHTDYNDGFVLPMTLDRSVWLAVRPCPGRDIRVTSLDYDQDEVFSLDETLDLAPNREGGWIEYIKGVAWVLQTSGLELKAWEGILAGDVPIGAGLSSSAALEMAAARAFALVGGLDWDASTMARLGQRAENEWVGVNCGIMDQMISAAGVAGHALLIDCRSLAVRPAPLPGNTVVVVMDTSTRRGLVGSAYNKRRTQCEAAASFFGVTALRDVSPADFAGLSGRLNEPILRRARHVITENERTLNAYQAMVDNDAACLGRLMNASHESMRDDFEISTDALNTMVACAQQGDGCYGARMTGGGFGGCAVALVETSRAERFAAEAGAAYELKTGLVPAFYVCRPTNGAEAVMS